MPFQPSDHTFALCAYGESPYLEECILSLRAQTVPSRLLIATSTPSEFISRLAEKHGIPLFVNDRKEGIGADWNFAYNAAETPLVTVAHQDDLYEPGYTEHMLSDVNGSPKPILWFCDYWELRNGARVHDNRNLRIKRLMLFPLKGRLFRSSRWMRRRILSLGCPICCPSVTYVRERAGREGPFSTEMLVSLDWDQWEKQSRKKGDFLYCPVPLLSHRIHAESATSALIASQRRSREDSEMFHRFWPAPVARFLAGKYAASEKSNGSIND